MTKSDGPIIPWYLRVLGVPIVVAGAAVRAVCRLKDKVRGK